MGDDEWMSTHADDGLTVGRTAELVGVSVRTLHHWDEIGLVSPETRTWSDYRIYTAEDVARIQRVLLYRELGMPLAKIQQVLDDPEVDVAAHLESQHAQLLDRIARLQEMVSAVEQMMEAENMGKRLTAEQQAEILGSDWDPKWEEEAKEKWSDTPEWAQGERVKEQMSAEDWKRVKEEVDAFEAELGEAHRAGVQPGSAEGNRLAEAHRASIGRWFDITHSKHVLIARSYVDDPRFAEHYDKQGAGVSAWLKALIDENARGHGVDPETAEWE